MIRVSIAVAIALVVAAGPAAGQSVDPAAAREQYRLARRLAAENATGADDALRKVVALDPEGPFADDAAVERAALRGLAGWPERLGWVSAAVVGEVRPWLERAASVPSADRALEARVLLALTRLEPLPGRDGDAARRELLAVAATDPAGPWGARARYAVGWLDRSEGADARARGAWLRVVVDAPRSEAAVRARTGLASLALRAGRPGRAATWAQSAAEAGGETVTAAAALRSAAVLDVERSALSTGGAAAFAVNPFATAGKSASALLRDAQGGLLIANRKEGTLERLDGQGQATGRWTLDEPTALGSDPFGRVLVAAGERLYVLAPGGARALGDLGRFAPASAVAGDASGRIWVLDRKGDRVGVLEPGASVVAPWREERGTRLAGLAESGGAVVAAASRGGAWLRLDPAGGEKPIGTLPMESIVSLCVDPAGRLAAIDDASGLLVRAAPDGAIVDRLELRGLGIEKPSAIACGPDGSLDIYDAASGTIRRIRR